MKVYIKTSIKSLYRNFNITTPIWTTKLDIQKTCFSSKHADPKLIELQKSLTTMFSLFPIKIIISHCF